MGGGRMGGMGGGGYGRGAGSAAGFEGAMGSGGMGDMTGMSQMGGMGMTQMGGMAGYGMGTTLAPLTPVPALPMFIIGLCLGHLCGVCHQHELSHSTYDSISSQLNSMQTARSVGIELVGA